MVYAAAGISGLTGIDGMYYGLHQWTAQLTNGMVDARFIALLDTALESPLGQIAMIPMLAWIANSATLERRSGGAWCSTCQTRTCTRTRNETRMSPW